MLQWRVMQTWWKSWRWLLVASLAAAAGVAAAELALRGRYRRRVLRHGVPASGQVTVVALGDSIVAGAPGPPAHAWPALLAEHLQMAYPDVTWRVINAGVPGDTASQGCARFDRDVTAAEPQIVLIAFGLNDCHPARHGMDRWFEEAVPRGLARSYLWRALQVRVLRWGRAAGWWPVREPERASMARPRTSLTGFADALTALIARTRALAAQPVLLTMTPLAAARSAGVNVRRHTHPRYNAAIRACAARAETPLVDLASAAGMPTGAFEPDGFHLATPGQVWVADQVFRQLDVAGLWRRLAAKDRR